MLIRSLRSAAVMFAMLAASGSASAAIMFTEAFDSATPNPNLAGYERFEVAGGVIRRDGTHSNQGDRRYLRTTETDYNEADFRFELTFTTSYSPEVVINYIGIGRGDRGPNSINNPYNKPYHSLFLRIHGPNSASGKVEVVNSLAHAQNIALLDSIPAGTHRALIEKIDNEITFGIDVDYNGIFQADTSHTFANFAAIAPFLDNTNSHLFFGTAQDFDSFDNWNLESSVPEPSTYVLASLGLLVLGLLGWRRKRN